VRPSPHNRERELAQAAFDGESQLSVSHTDAFETSEPAAWRVNDWRRQVPMSRSTFYAQAKAGRIELVKLGSATLVTTSPKDYIAALRNRAAKPA
jgi:hypothetical protein